MPDLKPDPRRRRRLSGRPRRGASRPASNRPQGPGDALKRLAFELGAIFAEVIAIPLRAWMRVAEAAGSLVLAGARFAWPRLLAAWRALRALVRTLERVVTPARATAVVALCAAGVLAGSQFTEYRAVRVGDTQYQPVETVAPAPQVAEKDPRTAHGNWLLVVAAVSGVIVAISYGGRWRMARLLFPLGLVAVAVAVFGDHDTGLNAGQAGNSYEGAKAVLLDGYWTQIVAGAMLALCGPLLSRYLRMREAPSRSRAKAGRRSGRRGHAGRSRAVRTVG